jgi:hypothetical protein
MKPMILDEIRKDEVSFYLEKLDTEIILMAVDVHGNEWNVLSITEDGLRLNCAINESSGIPVDHEGFIKVSKEDA